ncbi:hypothetical protein [Archangium primigenium]|uniref:hypothetical protein n=1 Tax=[Archangium] primigenium TaxID=2792470 RepID=UPI001959A826|nr:hypothetical protein [Archangium primigenium]MBM7119448.1 hypothetical protein [Archangium primigenium]
MSLHGSRAGWIAVGLLAASGGAGGTARAGPVVREEARVRVDGEVERWRLVWRAPPRLACFEMEGVTCPCEGFAQGEAGALEWERERPGTAPERLDLTPLFGPAEPGAAPVEAVLRGWAVSPRDAGLAPERQAEALRGRPRVRAMVLGDYDHDGQAREFVLQTQASGCGLREAVLLGVDKAGRMRALGTVAHPGRPLVLAPGTWARLLRAASVTAVQTPCGDHGSQGEEVLRVRADARGLHATREVYACTARGTRGALQSSEVL